MLADVVQEAPLLPLLARFAIAMMVIFVVPPLCRRVRLPSVVGLMAAGVLLGPYGLKLAPRHGEVAEFLADVGKLLLMFFAGLEIDLQLFSRTRNRAIGFGLLTFLVPFLTGIVVALAGGYAWIGAVVIGSLLASHTLIAYPIVAKLGRQRDEAVTVTVGATVITDVAALLVLALCIPVHTSGFSPRAFGVQLFELAVFVPLVIFGLGWVTRRLFALKPAKEGQFALLLSIVAVAAVGAEAINLEGIIGAFLAGLAVSSARDCEAKHELEFMGNNFFIPMFFITIGFLIDVRVFVQTLATETWFVVGIVGGLIAAKFLAAEIARALYKYSRVQALTMWSLSLPQVAATLAAALVAYQTTNAAGARLIDEPAVNTIIVLLVVTAVLGPILTERYAKQLPAPAGAAGSRSVS